MKIVIFGLGYVGLTAAGCLTKQGHHVVGVDVNEDKVRLINSGVSPITEPGLPELLAEAIANGRLRAVTAVQGELDNATMAIVCVGTPSAPDGSHNMAHIAEVSRQIALAISENRAQPLTVVYRSTMRPGATEQLIIPIFKATLGNDISRHVELVYNPEFLREASAIKDFFSPPKIVIGTGNAERSVNMDALNQGIEAPVFYTGFREAEITKFVDNTWHATKVAFANEIGRICVRLGISASMVHEIFVSDTKLNISPYYMRPGGAFGGSCLPKDVRALQHLAGDTGVGAALIESLIRTNEAHKHFAFELCARDLPARAEVLVVGLAFKANSDDLRESPNVDLIGKLLRAGHRVAVYDPGVDPSKLVGQNLGYAYVHLPSLSELLVDKTEAETRHFNLVVDANGQAGRMSLSADRIVDIFRLTTPGPIAAEARSDVA
jgi:GDP-mannose 6-dehydrogenase